MGRNPKVRRHDIKVYIRRTSRRRGVEVSKMYQMEISDGEEGPYLGMRSCSRGQCLSGIGGDIATTAESLLPAALVPYHLIIGIGDRRAAH